jgi:uncharacterized protein DUF4232
MRRVVRALAATAAAVVLLASCSGSSGNSARRVGTVPVSASVGEATTSSSAPPESTTSTAAPPAGPERCQGPAVRIAFLDSRTAAGHSLAVFEVRNSGTRPCRLAGHPGVDVLDPSGRVLATAQRRAGTILGPSPPAPVTIPPGGAAYFGVESESVCADDLPPVDSDRMRVVLPENTAPAEVAVTITVCPQPEILVSPVRAAQSEITGR